MMSASIDWTERVAIAGSAACMVHCLALPLIVAVLPALASVVAIPESFHLAVLGLAVPAAAFALFQGRARHAVGWPLLLGAAGLACLAAGALTIAEGAAETLVTVAGSLMLATAHVANWRLRRACCGAPAGADHGPVTILTHGDDRRRP